MIKHKKRPLKKVQTVCLKIRAQNEILVHWTCFIQVFKFFWFIFALLHRNGASEGFLHLFRCSRFSSFTLAPNLSTLSFSHNFLLFDKLLAPLLIDSKISDLMHQKLERRLTLGEMRCIWCQVILLQYGFNDPSY